MDYCTTCGGDGCVPPELHPGCASCRGGLVVCPQCIIDDKTGPTGKMPCVECDGRGYTRCHHCNDGDLPCDACEETGRVECDACGKQGWAQCPHCAPARYRDGLVECTACWGSGRGDLRRRVA